ncbi:MAG: Ni/Fe hydrogenase subunit gamma [Acidobacteria bacterium RIFCSPHIGHO2_12_FULL_67_30]|nr:MAG: Ni/Fe hydrogenase subunit gamma [Acidobacteria bacterium RIFCSPHIGHO2_02_FULL_67_57]OFV86173.1 MAG: Ni/Fe hydrogenase subunit gamma [Acidobacteria bacterium RIFCSPHIGHO2_01_FULL_67_28]OFV86844.1 MAG: Ni/Fe hydrogenase subunit gamma [Acidobacteria bacterium RIFCSPHIGHO2_12_FULL_67_30]
MSVSFTPAAVRARADPMLPGLAVVRGVKPEAYGVSTFSLALADPAEAAAYRFLPGQFNMLYLPGFGEVAISVSSDPFEPQLIGHTIRFAGSVTRGLARLQPGDALGLRGPYGSAWPLEQARGRDLVIVAGGIGLAPLRPVVLSVLRERAAYGRVLLLYGGRTPPDLLYTEEFERWQAAGIETHVTVDRASEDWRGQVGVVPQLFYRIRLDPRRTVVFTCGPEIMMRFVIYEALARRLPKEGVYLSMERNMKCAVGFCGHCQFGPTFLCRQGPVLNFAAIEPFFGREDF